MNAKRILIVNPSNVKLERLQYQKLFYRYRNCADHITNTDALSLYSKRIDVIPRVCLRLYDSHNYYSIEVSFTLIYLFLDLMIPHYPYLFCLSELQLHSNKKYWTIYFFWHKQTTQIVM